VGYRDFRRRPASAPDIAAAGPDIAAAGRLLLLSASGRPPRGLVAATGRL